MTLTADMDAMQTLRDQWGPWPATEKDVTARGLYRQALVQAAVTNARIQEAAGRTVRHALIGQFVGEWEAAALWHAMVTAQFAAPWPDEVAAYVWNALEDGGACGELLWQWMTEEGMRPGDLYTAVRAAVAADPEASAPVAPPA
jgi:hypothetical protein